MISAINNKIWQYEWIKMGERLKHYRKEYTWMADKHVKTSLIIKDIQINTPVR
jgi:hypothetical protein